MEPQNLQSTIDKSIQMFNSVICRKYFCQPLQLWVFFLLCLNSLNTASAYFPGRCSQVHQIWWEAVLKAPPPSAFLKDIFTDLLLLWRACGFAGLFSHHTLPYNVSDTCEMDHCLNIERYQEMMGDTMGYSGWETLTFAV